LSGGEEDVFLVIFVDWDLDDLVVLVTGMGVSSL
jgi:hypothetical protein